MKQENKYYYEMKSGILNILSIVLFAVLVLITYFILKNINLNITINSFEYSLTLILIIPYFMFHEVLHSVGYVVNGAKFKNITYGMHLEKGILCCSCKQTIEKRTILWSLVYPLIFIGIVTYIIGIMCRSKILIMLSIANISGCIGDIIMFIDFLKLGKFKFFEYDNPMAFGIITDRNLENEKLFGLKRVEEDNFKQTVDKKISVSKKSIIIFLIYSAICLLNMFI